jgi:uncharacterized damage-inducible protein DinB
MSNPFERIRKVRQSVIDLVNDLSIENVNTVPNGFNNNIAWNLGHLFAAQQGVSYVRAGLSVPLEEKYFLKYKPGTRPEGDIELKELEQIKELLLTSINQVEADYNKNIFANYPKWTTRYGVEINNIDDALQFLMFHEGLHTGVIMAMKKLVAK